MKKHFILILVVAGIYFPASAQKKAGQYKFSSLNNFVVAFGQENQLAGGFQSVNGFKKDKWFAGVGIGVDFYRYRSIPVFIDVRREFGEGTNKFFVYANAGLNVDWMQEEYKLEPTTWDPNLRNKYHTGLYTDAGVGFFAGSKKGHGFVVSLGHSVKTFKESRWYSDWMNGKPAKDIYKFNFSRAVLKLGWKF